MRRRRSEDAEKASYDDLDAIKDFLKLSGTEMSHSTESFVSDKSSAVQRVGAKDGNKAEALLTDMEMCSLSTLTDEGIIVPIDGYLVDSDHALNNSAQDTAIDNAKSPTKDSSQHDSATVENEGIDERGSRASTDALRSSVRCMSTNGQTCSTKHSPRTAASSSSNGLIAADASSGNLSSSKDSQQHPQNALDQKHYSAHSSKKHELQTVIQKNSSSEECGTNDGNGFSFHKHIVRYDPQVFLSKKHLSSKVIPKVHEMGNVEVQSFKRFPGFKGSGKIARIPKAADVLYVVKDAPESGGPRSHNKATSPLTDALEMIRKEPSRARDSQVVNRFFIGPVLSSLDINDTTEPSDYRNRNLYDIVEKKGSWGRMTRNYIKVVGRKFICYKSKSMRLTESVVSSDYFHSPDDIYSYYPEKYSLDLKESQLYVVTGKSVYTLSPCRSCYYTLNKHMEEISNVDIMQITRENDAYRLCVGRDGQSRHISITNLDFVIYSSGQYYWFRCRNASSLVKWLTVIQIRQGLEGCPV